MGVEIFDVKLLTCLWTVWLQQRIRYFQCSCPCRIPDCSSSLAGFRFLSSTEQHDGPIEIEPLAITWDLEQTKFFALGCCKLAITRDQKPTNKVFGGRMLDEISNTGIFHLKKKTLPWCFNVIHLPSKSNCAADAAWHYPASTKNLQPSADKIESLWAAVIHQTPMPSHRTTMRRGIITKRFSDEETLISLCRRLKKRSTQPSSAPDWLSLLYTKPRWQLPKAMVLLWKDCGRPWLSQLHPQSRWIRSSDKTKP